MKLKYAFYAFLSASVVIGWNAFLVKRDSELFKAYDQQIKYDHPTPKEAFCKSQPNCKVN